MSGSSTNIEGCHPVYQSARAWLERMLRSCLSQTGFELSDFEAVERQASAVLFPESLTACWIPFGRFLKVRFSFLKWHSKPRPLYPFPGSQEIRLIFFYNTDRFSKVLSNIYRSTDGGHTYTNITSKIQGEYIRRKNGVMTATADSERVVLIVNNHPLGYSDSSTIYVTLDKGKIV